MRVVIARHSTGITISKTSFGAEIDVSIPAYLFDTSTENLENNRQLFITKCSFFGSYLGIGNSKWDSVFQTMKILESVFNKLIDANSFLSYLTDKKFQVAKTLNNLNSLAAKCYYHQAYCSPETVWTKP